MAEPSSQDCYVALELSRAKWLVGALLPGRSKVITMQVPGGDTAGLLDVLGRLAARAGRDGGQTVSVKVCFEAGYGPPRVRRRLVGLSQAAMAVGWSWA